MLPLTHGEAILTATQGFVGHLYHAVLLFAVLTLTLFPLYRVVLTRVRNATVAALLMTLLVFTLFIGPVGLLGAMTLASAPAMNSGSSCLACAAVDQCGLSSPRPVFSANSPRSAAGR